MGDSTVGICVIGTGRAGMIHARNYAAGIAGARLVALVDPVDEALQVARRELEVGTVYSDYRDALGGDGIDAVVVVAPTAYHCEIVLAAAKAGKHVFCEKPMAMTAAVADD